MFLVRYVNSLGIDFNPGKDMPPDGPRPGTGGYPGKTGCVDFQSRRAGRQPFIRVKADGFAPFN